jgi:hypothetical protein
MVRHGKKTLMLVGRMNRREFIAGLAGAAAGRHSMPVSFAIIVLTATMTSAACNGTLQQLQKNCEKLAAETFRRESVNDEDRVAYRAHYNARLNKCFYVETYISATRVGINTWVYLSDLQENRIYGGFHKSSNIGLFYCNLQDQECHSEANWNELVNPYMED